MLHVPILCEEVVENLVIRPKGIYMDCTVGFGGHSESILKKLDNKGWLLGVELDPYALKNANKKLSQNYKNFSFYNCSYVDFPQILTKNKLKTIDGFLFDLGISSYQVNSSHRGFSYQSNGPLDMRFNPEDKNKNSAKDILNSISQERLTEILKLYSEDKNYRKISKSIINYREKNGITTTDDLKNAVNNVTPYQKKNKTLSKVFQAIRIIVNDEINILKNTLKSTLNHLNVDGRIAVITFHSIEDRIVKHFFNNNVFYKDTKTYDIEYKNSEYKLNPINKKPFLPSLDEIKKNSRSRSAKLRIAKKAPHVI